MIQSAPDRKCIFLIVGIIPNQIQLLQACRVVRRHIINLYCNIYSNNNQFYLCEKDTITISAVVSLLFKRLMYHKASNPITQNLRTFYVIVIIASESVNGTLLLSTCVLFMLLLHQKVLKEHYYSQLAYFLCYYCIRKC